MILCVINNGFQYELEKLCRIYLPFEKIEKGIKSLGEVLHSVLD